MKKTKEQKGITLIALIITIVVLMILAAVAINSITNEGILEQAGSTANKYNQAVKNEESYLQDYEDMLTAANGGYQTYAVGTPVTLKGEDFYVIEDKTSLGKVVLLAKEGIITDKNDTNYLTQSENANTIAFSATNYWWDTTESKFKDEFLDGDLTETGVPDESHYAARAAYDYGLKLGGKGRLMSYDELTRLFSDPILILHGVERFCVGHAYDETHAWSRYMGDIDGSAIPYDSTYYGVVVPVIEISKSKLS